NRVSRPRVNWTNVVDSPVYTSDAYSRRCRETINLNSFVKFPKMIVRMSHIASGSDIMGDRYTTARGGNVMKQDFTDPGVEQIYRDLASLDINSLTPEESSATWEIIKKLYKEERRRKRKVYLIRIAAALSTTLLLSSALLLLTRKQKRTQE